MILIVLFIIGCMILVAAISVALIKRANRRMDEQNREMKTYLQRYEKTKDTTTDPSRSDDC